MFIAQKDIEVIRGYRSVDWWRILLHGSPVGEKFSECSWLKTVSAEDMIPYLGAFFYEAYVNWTVVQFLFLFEFDRCG